MKRYMLFFGEYYYPSGGWNDFEGDFDSVEEVMEYLKSKSYDWFHIIDSQTKLEV